MFILSMPASSTGPTRSGDRNVPLVVVSIRSTRPDFFAYATISASRLFRNGSPSLYMRSTLIGFSKSPKSSMIFWKISNFMTPWNRPVCAIMSRWPVGQNVHLKLQELAGSTKTMNGVVSGITVSSGVRPTRLMRGSSRAFMWFPAERSHLRPTGEWLIGVNQADEIRGLPGYRPRRADRDRQDEPRNEAGRGVHIHQRCPRRVRAA